MIPYIEWKTIMIGPVTLYVWGLFMALGFLLAAVMASKMVKKRGGDPKVIFDLTSWMMATGFVGGRLGYVFFYDLPSFLERPLDAFKVWDGGLSLYGGLITSVIVGLWYLKKRKVDVMQYADAAIFGLPFGLWIGRIGCFLIHDHPGTASDFILAVEYPDGIVRHDNGLYLSINGFLLAMVFLILARKKRPVGTYISVFALWYGFVRFFLDFTRTIDVRYLGLTPAQYFSVGLFVFGIWHTIKLLNKTKSFKHYG